MQYILYLFNCIIESIQDFYRNFLHEKGLPRLALTDSQKYNAISQGCTKTYTKNESMKFW